MKQEWEIKDKVGDFTPKKFQNLKPNTKFHKTLAFFDFF